MATAIGRAPSTVQSWETRGSIPDQNKPDILKVALDNGLDLKPEDFFPTRTPESIPSDLKEAS